MIKSPKIQLKNRAETPEQKAEIIARILKCWQETFPSLRFGQMLLNLVEESDKMWLIEDATIAERLEEWEEKAKKLDIKI